MKQEMITNNVNETISLGSDFALELTEGCLVALKGDLGVGKTAFTKGIAKGLGIDDVVSSPTFTLMKEYEGRLQLKHIDAYRLEDSSSESLALFDLLENDAVVVIEWSEYLSDNLSFDFIITYEELDESKRHIVIEDLRV